MTSTHEVAITGLGLLTAAGADAGTTWQGVSDGVPTAGIDPSLGDVPVPLTCRVPDFDAVALLGTGPQRGP